MRKFAVISGFLGAGKTTAMMALSARGSGTAMISNDLGEGVMLADHKLARLRGCEAYQIEGECICFCHERLAERLRACFDAGCELVLSDIPGFGVGALEHVYHGLTARFPGRFALAPFTVLVEPQSLRLLQSGTAGELGFILDAQLREADLIVLSKCELLAEDELRAARDFLAQRYPDARTLAISAKTGLGLDALRRALLEGEASLRHPAIDYEDKGLQRAMGRLSEYYLQYRALVCCDDFDGDAYLRALADAIGEALRTAGAELPHLKLLAWSPDGDFGKLDLLGVSRGGECAQRFARPCTDLAVILNASAVCPDALLDRLMRESVLDVSRRFNLELTVFRKDCFGMGD